MIYCPRCGKEIGAGMVSCTYCSWDKTLSSKWNCSSKYKEWIKSMRKTEESNMLKMILKDKKEDKVLRFGMVKNEQPFINLQGSYCIKHCPASYISIADSAGIPYSSYEVNVSEGTKIREIKPEVERYEW
jgi:hypothetical protein